VEKSLRGGFRTIGPDAKLGDVQIDFQDSPFRPQALDQNREIGLEPLAKKAASGPEE
jgi:hypothetical protein